MLYARTGSREDRARGVSAFLVDTATKGVSRTRFNDLGSKILSRGSVFFDDVFVPEDHLLGAEGWGFLADHLGF